jgi:nucleoside phosphorylase
VNNTLSACTCNIVHNELYKFDDAVTDNPPKIDYAVSALRCFQLRGKSGYIREIARKLRYENEEEDMSCPRFLCKVFRSINRVEQLAPQIDNYWGAYLLVGIDLLVAAQNNNYALPNEFAFTNKIKLSLRKSSKETDLRNFCNIIDGLQQVLSLSKNTYDCWQDTKKMLGIPMILQAIFERFSDSILRRPDWYSDEQFRKSAFGLVDIWCNLERMYVVKLKQLIDSNKQQEAYQANILFDKEVKGLRGKAASLVQSTKRAGALEDGSFKINRNFEIACFELDTFQKSTRLKTKSSERLPIYKGNKTLLILTVLEEELLSVVNLFRRYCKSTKGFLDFKYDKEIYIGQFYKGSQAIQLMVGQCRGTGNETSGVDAMNLIAKCKEITKSNPFLAMLVGICAGSMTRKKAQIGDIVVPRNVLDDSIYKLQTHNQKTVRLPELLAPGTPDPKLHRLCLGIRGDAKQWRRNIKKPKGIKKNPQVHFDPIVTNNAFLQDNGKYLAEFQNSINRKAIAYEMEAGGFANACQSERVPFLVIRGISDLADRDASKRSFRPYAAKVAAAFALAVAKNAPIPKQT